MPAAAKEALTSRRSDDTTTDDTRRADIPAFVLPERRGFDVSHTPAGLSASSFQQGALDRALVQFRASVTQRAALSGEFAPAPVALHRAAQQGVSGGGGGLPHLATIQRAFGRHDVSGIRSHVGGGAAEACDTMGARAYATGQSVAFRTAPDLHTAAHEAAHVIQQRHGVALYGGIGRSGDVYEQHADAVADAVVRGESAEGLLDRFAGGGSERPGVQMDGERLEDRTMTRRIGPANSLEEFEEQVRQFLAGQVRSRSTNEATGNPIHRERSIVPPGRLRNFWTEADRGRQVEVTFTFQSNGFSYRSVLLARNDAPADDNDEREDPPSGGGGGGGGGRPPSGPPPSTTQDAADDIVDGSSRGVHPGVAWTSRGLSAARVGTVLLQLGGTETALGAGAAAAELALAPLAGAVSCGVMLFSVFNIFNQMEGENAAGMGIVDYVWILASRVFNDRSASSHQSGIRYAQSMDERGQGDIYRDALRPARQHADRAWADLQQHAAQLREHFGTVEAFADHLYGQLRPQAPRNVGAYSSQWYRRWRANRSFYAARGLEQVERERRSGSPGSSPPGEGDARGRR